MNCLEAQGLVMKYINNELSGPQLENFLKHIDRCPDCREDLEIYYILTTGMNQFDNDYVDTYNFHEAFEACDRKRGGPTAPASGLYFQSVFFEEY